MKPMTVDIEILEGYIVVPATVHACLSGRFLLDTGADVTVVSSTIAEKLGLQTTRYHEGGVAGGKTIRVPLSRVDSFAIGERSISLDPVAVIDLGNSRYGTVDGIIGSDYLKEFAITIDYAARTLTFEDVATLQDRKAQGETVELAMRSDTTPFMSVLLNGMLQREYKLDTGAGETYIPSEDLTLLGIDLEDPQLLRSEVNSSGGSYTVIETCLDSFSVGPGLEVANLPIRSYQAEYGFIGANYLRNFILTLNYKERYVILSRA
jgi:predicted aspartyl protease